MAMALADFKRAVDFVRQSARFELARPGPQAHGAAQFFDAA